MAGYILIVDDEADVREGLSELLSGLGYQTEKAEHGLEALELIERSGTPGMVLLDLKMPVMSGWELMKVLRSRETMQGIPVLILSGYGFEWEAELMGATGYIPKPVQFAKLKDAIAQALGVPSKRAGWVH